NSVHRALTGVRPAAEAKGIALNERSPDALPTLRTDPVRLEQILVNLLSNAVRHSPEGGVITVQVEPQPAAVAFRVSDQGPGIPTELQERIFEPFERFDPHSGLGTELGLPVSRGVAEVLVLDVMLPKKTGLQVAAELRREGSKTPILMLTARDATEDVVRGLDAGADDYLAKPFKFEELLARVRALVRRGGASRTELLSYGPVQVDRLKHKASVNGKRLDLTPKEFQLLEHFMLRPEDVLRRTELLEKVW